MMKRNKKIISYGLIICLAGLMLVFKGCGSEKREQPAKDQNPGISEQQKIHDEKFSILDNERKLLLEKIEQHRQVIQKLAREYGSVDLNARQNMIKQRITSLQTELNNTEVERITLEAQVKAIEQKESKEAEDEQKLAVLKSELEPAKESEKQLRETVEKENAEYIELAHKQKTLDEYREKMKLTKEMFDMVCQRLQQLESTQQSL